MFTERMEPLLFPVTPLHCAFIITLLSSAVSGGRIAFLHATQHLPAEPRTAVLICFIGTPDRPILELVANFGYPNAVVTEVFFLLIRGASVLPLRTSVGALRAIDDTYARRNARIKLTIMSYTMYVYPVFMSGRWVAMDSLDRAEARIKLIKQSMPHVYVIHYSCESFVDKPSGYSPRIATIAVKNLESWQSYTFSIYRGAEKQSLPKEDIESHYDKLEREMLDEFFDFVNANENRPFVHWNMRDANYGFQALYNRYQRLGGKPVLLPERNLVDLADTFVAIYGRGYVPHPRLENIIRMNGISVHNFLSGPEEAQAFINKEYLKLQRSTLQKVDGISEVLMLHLEGKLRTKSSSFDQYLDQIMASPKFKLVSIVAVAATLFSCVFGVVVYYLSR